MTMTRLERRLTWNAGLIIKLERTGQDADARLMFRNMIRLLSFRPRDGRRLAQFFDRAIEAARAAEVR
jgi:hypothetical protein